MANSTSSLTNNNLAECLLKDKYNDCKSSLEYISAKDGLQTFRCVSFCKKNYEKKFDDLAKRFEKHASVDGDTKKFCLMLQKDVYPNEYTEE